MKKLLCIIFLFCMSLTVFAEARQFDVLTKHKYQNVKLDGVNWRGIRIRHSKGSRYITDKDLTAKEKELLKEELEIWQDKLEKHNRRYGGRKKIIEAKTKELQDLQKNLPKMNRNQIGNWFQMRIGTNPYKKDFKSKYNANYMSVRVAPAVLKACEARLRTLDTADFKKMADECLSKTSTQANGILKRRVGAAFNHTNFTDSLRLRFLWVPLKDRNDFIKKMNTKIKEEKICCICKKEPSLTLGGYGKICAASICSKCKKELVKDKNSKEKICETCKAAESGGAGGEGAPGAPEEASENPFE